MKFNISLTEIILSGIFIELFLFIQLYAYFLFYCY